LASADVLYNAAVADRLGISPIDMRYLSWLDSQGAATAGHLARWSGLTTGAITGVINRLKRAGLVRRAADPADPADARRVRVVPVEDRRAQVDALMRPLGEQLQTAAAALSPAERRALTEFVEAACRILAAEARRIRYDIA